MMNKKAKRKLNKWLKTVPSHYKLCSGWYHTFEEAEKDRLSCDYADRVYTVHCTFRKGKLVHTVTPLRELGYPNGV